MIAVIAKVAGAGLAGLLFVAIVLAVSALFWGWVIMLVLGMLHSSQDWNCNLGYGICVLFGFLLSFVLG